MTSTASPMRVAQLSKRGSPGTLEDASPARKRQRLSSPSNDNGIQLDSDEFDSDDLAVIDEIERAYTQTTAAQRAPSEDRDPCTQARPVDTSFQSASASLQAPGHAATSLSVPSTVGFVKLSIASLQATTRARSPSPVSYDDQDYSSWLQGDTSHSASFSSPMEFSTVSGKKWEVSAAALEKSAAKFKAWEAEFDKEDQGESSTSDILKTINNVPSQRAAVSVPSFVSASSAVATSRAVSVAPLVKVAPQQAPATPVRPVSTGSVRATPRLPVSVVAATALPKMLGMTPRARALQGTRPKFVTPFKQGLGPSSQTGASIAPQQPPRSTFSRSVTYPTSRHAQLQITKPERQQPSPPTSPPSRQVLAEPTIRPCQWVQDELEDLGIPSYIFQISTQTALNFAFTPSSSEPTSSIPKKYTVDAALEELQRDGCKHATQQWVRNHWSLILWKLAGQIVNDAEPLDCLLKKWNWMEVMRQLRHRYTREYVNGARPALRAILERDANAGAPMTLCVSAISWSESKRQDDGTLTEPRAELILTDGWYFVRACVDGPITRALQRNTLRVGRKIACQGATLDPPHADGKDVWSAYDSTILMLTGNSTSMAPWHAKLGFHQPFTAGLRSLTPDGGSIAMIDVVVVRPFPAGFIEYHEDGTKDPPHNEAEEREMVDKWRAKRMEEQERLWNEFKKQAFTAQGWLEKLQRIAGNRFSPSEDDSMPDYIEDLYEEIMEDSNPSERLKHISANDAGWMARFLEEKCTRDHERAASDIETELATCCPPRNVRSFRIVRVKDAQVVRRPTTCTAQLTVWDAANWDKDMFAEGTRFQITNLAPSQPKSWGKHFETDSEIFLITKRNSKFNKISSVRLP